MKIAFKWVGGAFWILKMDDIKIACDPVLCPKGHVQDYKYFKTKRLNEPVYNFSDFHNIGIWLLTHNHEDHIDNFGLQVIEHKSKIIAHKSLNPLFNDKQFSSISYLNWNMSETILLNGIKVEILAIPAIHAFRKFFSSKIGNGNGYLVEISKDNFKYNIYITGDSVYKKSRIKALENKEIDLIIVNAGAAMVGKSFFSKIIGRITNNKSDIIKLNSDLKPKILVPVHWGTFTHYTERLHNESFPGIENVKIIEPGNEIILNE